MKPLPSKLPETPANKTLPSPPASSVSELTRRNVESVVRWEEQARQAKSASDRFCGSVVFLWIHVAGFSLWILVNTVPGGAGFDPYPFDLLKLIVALEAIFLTSIILISQNSETKLAERRNHLDLQINLLSEQENTQMLKLLRAIAEKTGVQAHEEFKVLEQTAHPEELVAQIEHAEDAAK